MLKLIDMKKAIKFLITMYALTVETKKYVMTPCESFLHCNNGSSILHCNNGCIYIYVYIYKMLFLCHN